MFVCPFLAVLSMVDIAYSKIASNSNNFEIEAWREIMKGNVNADVIINGNSRACFQYDPTIIDSILGVNSYNIGMDGGPANRHVRKYHLYRRYNRKPKLISQNIDCMTFYHKVGYSREQFFPYFWNFHMRREFYSSEPFSFWEKNIPMYRYLNYDPKLFLSNSPRKMTKGYQSQTAKWDGKEFLKIDSIDFVYNEITYQMFKEYISNVRDEGIKVLFVYAPIYIGVTQKMTNLNEMYSFYQKIAKQYDIPILDYTYMDICRDTSYFYNATHLNKLGAEIFSDSLACDIKRLKLLKK